MSRPTIEEFLIDEANLEKFHLHSISPDQVWQVLENAFAVVPNRTARRAPLLVLGRDHGGNCIAIPVEPTHEKGLWRPITAWRCKPDERIRLERYGG